MEAAGKGDLEGVQRLLSAGEQVNAQAVTGTTALMMAAYSGSVEIVRLLLSHGADPDLEDGSHRTALSEAITKGHVDIALLLLDSGANPDVPDLHSSVLEGAAVRGQYNVVGSLVRHGADLTRFGGDALRAAAWKGFTDIVRLLLDNGVDVNSISDDAGTALVLATNEGHDEVAQLLIERGANVNIKGKYGASALMNSINGNEETVGALLEKGASEKGAALISAAKQGDESAVRTLLEYGVEDADLRTALVDADYAGRTTITSMLISALKAPPLRSRLLLVRPRKGGCDIAVWRLKSEELETLLSLDQCPTRSEVFLTEVQEKLIVRNGDALREISIKAGKGERSLSSLPFKEGTESADRSQRWNSLGGAGHLHDGRPAIIKAATGPSDDEDLYLYAYAGGRWSIVDTKHCPKYGSDSECTFAEFSGRYLSVWPDDGEIRQPMMLKNPFVVDRGVVPEPESASRPRIFHPEDRRYLTFKFDGHETRLIYTLGEDDWGNPYMTSLHMQASEDKAPIQLCSELCRTSISDRYLLINGDAGLQLIDLETGKAKFDDLKNASWIN